MAVLALTECERIGRCVADKPNQAVGRAFIVRAYGRIKQLMSSTVLQCCLHDPALIDGRAAQ
jgi:hypothetical protein